MTGRPGPPGRPRFEIADIVRRYRAELEAEQPLTIVQRRALSAIATCRTAALGGYLDLCPRCGFEHPAYNSCRNRHCPKCQALVQEKWILARSERVLPVRHFHVVFTLPSELRSLAKYRPREIFGALLAAMSESLLELGQTHFGACLGITMVLHTWTRDLRFHPHAHALVTAGGVDLATGQWIDSARSFLFPYEAMGTLLRGKMMSALHKLSAQGRFEGFDDFADPLGFDALMRRLASHHRWIVFAKKPFRRVEHLLRYLGHYTHRVALSNSRLVDVTDAAITFRTKNGKTVSLPPVEFLRRFVQHVLPDGFHKIRHSGLYAGTRAHGTWTLARARLEERFRPGLVPLPSWQEHLRRLTGVDVLNCPRCGACLEHRPMPRLASPSRAPPGSVAA